MDLNQREIFKAFFRFTRTKDGPRVFTAYPTGE